MKDFIESFFNDTFVQGVLSGLTVALLLWIFAVSLKRIKKLLIDQRFVNVLSKTKILRVYKNFRDAETQIYRDAEYSKKIFIFAIRGGRFFDLTSELYKLLKKEDCDIRVLLLDPNSQTIKSRLTELSIPTTAEVTNTSIALIEDAQKKNINIRFAKHKEKTRLRFYIFDNTMYLSFGLKDSISVKSQIYRIGNESHLYKSLSEQFEDLWDEYYHPNEEDKLNG